MHYDMYTTQLTSTLVPTRRMIGMGIAIVVLLPRLLITISIVVVAMSFKVVAVVTTVGQIAICNHIRCDRYYGRALDLHFSFMIQYLFMEFNNGGCGVAAFNLIHD